MSIERVVDLMRRMTDEEVAAVMRGLRRSGRNLRDVLWQGTPEEAYWRGRSLGSSEILRATACREAKHAYWYALDVDKAPHGETRASACGDPEYAYWYALNVEGCAHDETRKAACKDPEVGCWYAKDVDTEAHPVTWEAVKGTPFESEYRQIFDVGEGELWEWE